MLFQQTRARTSGRARVYIENHESRIEGDVPSAELRTKLSYQDAKAIEFLRGGKWGQAVIKELDELKEKAEGRMGTGNDDPKVNRYKAKFQYREAKRAASTVYLFDDFKNTFPTTLLKDVLRIMRKAGIEYDIVKDYQPPTDLHKFNYTAPEGHEPRAYQDAAVRIGAHCRCGVFAMATNAGKTSVMLRIIKERGLKTLIVVQKQELMFQIHEVIRTSMGIEAGMLGAGESFLRPITIAIVNSACTRIDELKKYGFDCVFVDEGHHAASKIHHLVLDELKPFCKYSMTGTDFRTKSAENIILQAAFGGTVMRVTNQYMIEHGYSAKIQAEIVKCKQELHPSLSWGKVYERAIILSLKRTQLLVDAVRVHAEAGKTILVIADQTGHGSTIYHLLRQAGVSARFMHGEKHRDERMAAREDFSKRRFSVLVGTTLYDEGVDFPTLDVVAFAGGKKAKGKVFQRLGRGQRRGLHTDGSRKDTAIVIDIFDHGHRLLKNHSLRRLLAMHDAGVTLSQEYTKLLEKEGFIHGPESTKSAGVETSAGRKRGRRHNKARHLLQDGGPDVPGKGREGLQDGGREGREDEEQLTLPDKRTRRRNVRGKARQA